MDHRVLSNIWKRKIPWQNLYAQMEMVRTQPGPVGAEVPAETKFWKFGANKNFV